jgi:hypothetical protein
MSAITSITLNRQACTLPVEPSDGPARTPTHSPAWALVAEIAERLEELECERVGYAADLVQHLACIAQSSRRSFKVTIQLLHCNYDDVLASYQEQAERRGVTKQDIHWEFQTEVSKLKRLYPRVYEVIMATRAQAMHHEDPISKSETVGRAGTSYGCAEE